MHLAAPSLHYITGERQICLGQKSVIHFLFYSSIFLGLQVKICFFICLEMTIALVCNTNNRLKKLEYREIFVAVPAQIFSRFRGQTVDADIIWFPDYWLLFSFRVENEPARRRVHTQPVFSSSEWWKDLSTWQTFACSASAKPWLNFRQISRFR